MLLLFAVVLIAAACSSNEANTALDKKHEPLPEFVTNTSEKIQETYIMATNYPEVVAGVPCYCGCFATDGHKSNLDCFIDQFGSDNAVKEYDSMGIA